MLMLKMQYDVFQTFKVKMLYTFFVCYQLMITEKKLPEESEKETKDK